MAAPAFPAEADARIRRRGELALMLTSACVKAPPSWRVADEVDECLLDLARSAEARVRLAIANRLADCPWAPPGVVRFLAGDELEIAEPILTRCLALEEEDLIALARLDGARRLMIASRLRVSEAVVAALAAFRESEVLDRLARNDGARLGEASAADFAAVAKGERELQIALAARDDLTAGFARALMAVAAQTVAQVLARRFPTLERRAVDEAAAGALADAAASDPEAEAARLVARLEASGRLDAAFVLRSLAGAPGPVFDHAMARLCAMPVGLWRRALGAAPVRACALACRTIGAQDRSVAPMVRTLTRQGRIHAVDDSDLARAASAVFADYDAAAAGGALHALGGGASIAA
ncbi:DUF2336 domain-containing protein [Marinicauda algicola]|nr:DUF2336 domain-containing protein [Marinicauda algicola]